ncbi:PGF-pre-PGF domain-containing protein [Candidatus Woesearchaeota archaeon]|nr:PGF-pre-PGF domain-containing protein [Candidatus Woesearchaeota archaeon]
MKTQKTWKIGFLISILLILASSAFAALPADLTFSTNMASAQAGQEFVVRLEKNPVGTPLDPFGPYNTATLTLPADISSLGEPLIVDLSTYTDGPIYTWHLNSSQSASGIYTIDIDVDGNTDSADINISGQLINPDFIVSMPAIGTQTIGEPFVVTVNIANGGGDATEINGYISAQKADINITSFSIASIAGMASENVYIEVTPNERGTAILYVGLTSYKKSDGTVVSTGHPDFGSVTSATDTFSVYEKLVVDLNTAISIGVSGYDDSLYLDYYVSGGSVALADLAWSCTSDEPRIIPAVNPLDRRLNITTTEVGEYSGNITCTADDGIDTSSDSFEVNVNSLCEANWQWSDWGACQSDGTQTRTYSDLNNCGGAPVIDSQSCTYTPPRNGGGGGSSRYSKIFTWLHLDAGEIASMVINSPRMSISEAEFKVLNELKYVKIRVEEIRSIPESKKAEGPVHQYSLFTLTNINDSDIDYATIKFYVPKNWLSANNMDESEVALLRYHEGGWDELPTEFLESDLSYVYYKAESPGFSYFAVGKGSELAEEIVEEGTGQAAEEETADVTGESGILGKLGKGDEKITQPSEETAEEEEAEETTETQKLPKWLSIMIYVLIGVAVVCLVILSVVWIRSREKSDKPNKKAERKAKKKNSKV